MEKSEEILTVLKAVDNSLGTYMKFEIFDLFITNKRLVVINPKLHKWRVWLGINVRMLRRRETKKLPKGVKTKRKRINGSYTVSQLRKTKLSIS